MPYKDISKDREASKERMRKFREKGVTSEGVTDQGVTLELLPEWQHVKEFISCGDNLVKLQRIAGSLGKNAGDVMFMGSGLSMAEIGDVIGTLPPMLVKKTR